MTYSDLWVEKYRPTCLDDVVMEDDVRFYFNKIISGEIEMPNLLLHGKPGGGKTTIAKIIAKTLGWQTLIINASEENGVDSMRTKIVPFCQTMSLDGNKKLIIMEEADGLSSSGGNGSSAQELLKNLIESSSKYCRFIMLVNDVGAIDAAIKSRMQEFLIVPPKDGIRKYVEKIVAAENISVPGDGSIEKLVDSYHPDVRKTIQVLQQFSVCGKQDFDYSSPSDVGAEIMAKYVIKTIFSMKSGENNDEALMNLRGSVIENEKAFSGNYHDVLKSMFEIIASRPPKTVDGFKKKCTLLLKIQDGMYKHSSVIDKEINFFSTVVSLIS